MSAPRGRRTSWPDEVKREARLLYLMGQSPAFIVDTLGRRKGEWGLAAGPGIDTVKPWLRGLQRGAGTNGERWDPWQDGEATRRRVAAVAAWKARNATHADARWVTRGEALWIDRAASLLPDEPPGVLYRIARGALDLGDDEAALAALDMELVLFASEPEPSAATLEAWESMGIPRVVMWAMFPGLARSATLAGEYGDWRAWREAARVAGLDAKSMTLRELRAWAMGQEGSR